MPLNCFFIFSDVSVFSGKSDAQTSGYFSTFEKIKSLFNGNEQDFEIFIRVKAKETQKEINQRIEDAARELERNEKSSV